MPRVLPLLQVIRQSSNLHIVILTVNHRLYHSNSHHKLDGLVPVITIQQTLQINLLEMRFISWRDQVRQIERTTPFSGTIHHRIHCTDHKRLQSSNRICHDVLFVIIVLQLPPQCLMPKRTPSLPQPRRPVRHFITMVMRTTLLSIPIIRGELCESKQTNNIPLTWKH